MASTPSAAALSAVLRCQGNILTRKQVNNTRPAASVYGLGMTRGHSVKSYFHSLWRFVSNGKREEIAGGVGSVSARLETSRKSRVLVQNSPLTESSQNQWPKSKQTLSFNSSFKNHMCVRSKNLVVRLERTYLRKNPWTGRVCLLVWHRRKNLLHDRNVNMKAIFPHGLLRFLRDEFIYFAIAVSDSLRTQLNWNQLQPDCDNLRRSIHCPDEHIEDQTKLPEGPKPE